LTFSVEEAGEILGLCKQTAYVAVRNGDIPSITIGRRIVVPKAEFFRRFPELVEQKAKSRPNLS
jgi:excisionase family DNA binding protein